MRKLAVAGATALIAVVFGFAGVASADCAGHTPRTADSSTIISPVASGGPTMSTPKGGG